MKFSSIRPFRPSLALLIASLGVLLAGVSLRAQEETPLGATPQQIGVLYGPVVRHNARVRRHEILEGGTVIDGDLYSRNDLVIRVVFHGGIAVLLEYTRISGPLTAHDVNVLLAANAKFGTWEPGKDSTETNRFYQRSDGKALAQYTTEYDGSLLVASENTGNDFYSGQLMDH